MKYFTSLLTATLLSAASLTGCGWLEERMDIQKQTEKRFRLNPNPKEAYRIRIKIDGALGPMKYMDNMYIRYMARNCSYTINHFEGADAEPTKYLYPAVSQTGEYEYETVIYFDAMLDEDYFGQGVCRWQFDGFGGNFKATGKPEETSFTISDVAEDLIKEKKLVKYYWNGEYPYMLNDDGSIYNHDDVVSFGTPPDKLHYYSDEQRKALFTITVTLEEMKS